MIQRKYSFIIGLLLATLIMPGFAQAQDSLKLASGKRFLLFGGLQSGIITNFVKTSPDEFVGGVWLHPQYAVGNRTVRFGLPMQLLYLNKHAVYMAGPSISYAIARRQAGPFPLYGYSSLNLLLEYKWGTQENRIMGGGLVFELLQKAQLSTTLHRDLTRKSWWLQLQAGVAITKGNHHAATTLPN